MYIGNRLTGAYGIGVFKLRHTLSNYIIRILECQLFFTQKLHFFQQKDNFCLYSKFHSGYWIRTSVRPSGLAVAPAILRSFAARISFTCSGG